MIMMTISFKILQQMVLYIVHHDNPPLPFPFYSACFKNFCCCKIMFQEFLFVEELKDHGTISRKKIESPVNWRLFWYQYCGSFNNFNLRRYSIMLQQLENNPSLPFQSPSSFNRGFSQKSDILWSWLWSWWWPWQLVMNMIMVMTIFVMLLMIILMIPQLECCGTQSYTDWINTTFSARFTTHINNDD